MATSTSRLLVCIAWMIAGATASSCLPADTRPTPSTFNVRFVGSPLVRNGIPASMLQDGWRVAFDRVLVTLGNPRLQDDACTPYSEDGSDYSRIFDASITDPQKMGTLFGLGTCGFNWRLMNPSVDSIQSQGVTDDERTTLISPGSDLYNPFPVGVTLWVRGSATKDGVKKTFDWSFRTRRITVRDCLPSWDATPLKFSFPGDTQLVVDVELHPEVLFQDRLEGRMANLRFGAYADADDKYGDANGDITLDELGKMTLENAGITLDDLAVGDAGGSDFQTKCTNDPNGCTFEYFTYNGLALQVTRLAGTVTCSPSIGGGHR